MKLTRGTGGPRPGDGRVATERPAGERPSRARPRPGSRDATSEVAPEDVRGGRSPARATGADPTAPAPAELPPITRGTLGLIQGPIPRAANDDAVPENVVPLGSAARRALYSRPLPRRQLPPLREALTSAGVEAISPALLFPVPADIVTRLAAAKKVLVIGHVPPDGDCVGSALGLARALAALGKEAHACVDDDLPGNLRRLDDDPGRAVRRASALDADYDLVVVVDVAAADRIGAARDALQRAPEVMVIDHHLVQTSHEQLGLDPRVPLTTWIEPTADAASLLIAGAAEELARQAPAGAPDRARWKSAMLPLAVGMYTDTDGFARPGASWSALSGFKHVLGQTQGGELGRVEGVLDHHLPRAASRVLEQRPRRVSGLSEEAARLMTEVITKGLRVTRELASDRSTALLVAPVEVTELALAIARREDPRATESDVRGHLLGALDRLPATHELAVLLYERRDGVLVSTRSSTPGPALHLARAVAAELDCSGNGHLHMAGASPTASLEQTAGVVRRWFERFSMERELEQRAAGNL